MSRSSDEHPLRWDIAEEHLDEAAFLYGQRQRDLVSPLYTLQELANGVEGRLLAHVDALVLGGPRVARRLLTPRLTAESEAESFVAGFTLLGMAEDRLEAVLDVLLTGESHQRDGVRRALALTSRPDLGPRLTAAFDHAAPSAQAALLDVLVAWRFPPASRLDSLVASGEPELACAALRAARHFPTLLEAASVQRALLSESHEVRDAAMETGLRLSLPEAWRLCGQLVRRPDEGWETAAGLWALGASGLELGPLLAALDTPDFRRDALWALGFSGRRAAADALLPWMRDEKHAALAAEAFAAITGIPLEPAFVVAPEMREAGDEADSEGPDDELPRPDSNRIEQWWEEARPRFKATERYLAGSPWSPGGLLQALEHAPMRRRPLHALELAVRTGGRCVLDTGLLAARQRQDLGRFRDTLGGVPLHPLQELMRGWTPPAPAPRPAPRARATAPVRTPGALVLTGLGMVTAIGHGAVESCASLRARIVKPRPLSFPVLRLDEPGAAVATGHPLRGLVDGFTGLARHIKLGALALEDLVRSAELPVGDASFLQQTALILCLSPTRRDDWDFHDELLAEQLPARLLTQCGLALPARNNSVLMTGHASGLLALQHGAQLLQERRFQRVLVLGIDSLVEEDSLQWLASRKRLKTPEQPMGLMPGEAAAAVLLENGTEATRRATMALGTLVSVGAGRADARARKGMESGRALAQTLRQAWPANEAPVGDIYGDLNGEHGRAMEWGCAQVLLRETHPLDTAHVHAPAECLGDTGAASGLIAVGAALRAFTREYAHGDQALIWSSSDSGEFAAARLSRA